MEASRNGVRFEDHSLLTSEEANAMENDEAEQRVKGIDTRILMPLGETNTCSTRKDVADVENDKQSNTGNVFLNELYDKEVDIRKNFSDEEISDVRTAVAQQMEVLAKAIGEVDPRFKLQEIIPVGSAREGTQIIRPCEYDYILILEGLSRPGAVSLKCHKDQQYMFVSPEDNDTKSLFHTCIHKVDFKYTGQLSKNELRKHFRIAAFRAVSLCSEKESIKKDTGNLTCTPSKPTAHGPADMVIFEWQRKIKEICLPMKISVDLVLALKVDWEVFCNILELADGDVAADFKPHIQSVGSVLLIMPKRFVVRFKVAFTEAELLYSAELSEHHRTCYKLLKYIVNGEPLPLQTNARMSRYRYMFQDKTFLPSYALKLIVWHHHFTENCSEETDLSSCLSRILSRCDSYSTLEESLKHPAQIGVKGVTSELSESIGDTWFDTFYTTFHGTERLRRISKGFKKVRNVPMDQYNFEKFCNIIAIRGDGRYYASKYTAIHAIIIYFLCLLQIITAGYFTFTEPVWDRVLLWAVGSILLIKGTVQMQCLPSANLLIPSKRKGCFMIVLALIGVRLWYIIGLLMFIFSARGLTFYLTISIQGMFLIILIAIGHFCIYLRLKPFMTTEPSP